MSEESSAIKRSLALILSKLTVLFAFKGQISLQAFLNNLAYLLPAAIFTFFIGFAPNFQALLILGVLVSLASSVLRRLTDVGISRWIALIALIPLVGWVALAVLLGLPTRVFSEAGLKAKLPKPLITVLSFFTIFFGLLAPLAATGMANADKSSETSTVAEIAVPSITSSKSPTSSITKTASPTLTPTNKPSYASFAELIALLPVANEVTTGYNRDLFQHWIDADGDGCDTRDEVLIAESVSRVSLGSNCSINGGEWVSVYDGKTTTNSTTFDIDHFVPLKEAWDSGANTWDSSTRKAFANDLDYAGSLIAVTASSNRSKSDRDPSQWLPQNTDFKCEYVFIWVEVKKRWGLSVDSNEKSALETASNGCELSALTFSETSLTAQVQKEPVVEQPAPEAPVVPAVPEVPAPPAEPVAPAAPALDPQFRTCGEANANGFGNYVAGVNPEYAWYQDRDHDGVVCER